jgi:hypothetical protein
VQVAIRFTPQEVKALSREAERRGWTFAQVVRRRALKGLTVDETEAHEERPKAVGE